MRDDILNIAIVLGFFRKKEPIKCVYIYHMEREGEKGGGF